MMSKFATLIFPTMVLYGILSGCTTEQAYYGFQQSAKNECAKSVNHSDYADCMERANMSYQEYEQKRKEKDPDGN